MWSGGTPSTAGLGFALAEAQATSGAREEDHNKACRHRYRQMFDWLQLSFEQNTILWLLVSSVLGGIVGASMRFVFDVILPQQLQQRREVIAVKRKYRTPILLAAEELRNRLGNIIKNIKLIEKDGWLKYDPPGYYYISTLYVVGQFFGWLQILRRTVVYLDFTSTKETRQFERFLDAIEKSFSDPGLFQGASTTNFSTTTKDRWVFSFILQAVGDVMVLDEEENFRTIKYATFHERFATHDENNSFKQWLHFVGQLFQDLKEGDLRFRRIVAIYLTLSAFIKHIDPNHLRTKLPVDYWDLLSEEEARVIKQQINEILN